MYSIVVVVECNLATSTVHRKERETTEADTEVLMGIYRESPTSADSIKVCSGGEKKATAEEGAKDKRRKSVPSGRR